MSTYDAPELVKAIEEIFFAVDAGGEELTDTQLDSILDALHERFPGLDLTPSLCDLIAETFKAHLAARRATKQ